MLNKEGLKSCRGATCVLPQAMSGLELNPDFLLTEKLALMFMAGLFGVPSVPDFIKNEISAPPGKCAEHQP